MLNISVGKARWAIIPVFIALWPAWIRQVKFGLTSFPVGLGMFVLLFVWWMIEQRQIRPKQNGTGQFLLGAWLLLITYLLSFGILPPLGRQVLATLIIACSLLACYPKALAIKRVGFLALFPLTLPLETALQFVIGFPFRRMSAEISGVLLSAYGVLVEGTTLLYDSHPLEVDAACSGVLGLWAFLIVGATLSLVLQQKWQRFLLTMTGAGLASLGYNVLRTSMLFMYRFHSGVESTFMHTVLGAIAFVVTITIFAIIIHKMSNQTVRMTEGYSTG